MSGIRGVAGLRAAMTTIFQGSADVYRKTKTPDTSGGQTDTYAKVATLPCRYKPAAFAPREREARGVLVQSESFWVFTFEHDADVQPTDRLRADGKTFEVQGGGPASLGVYASFTATEIR